MLTSLELNLLCVLGDGLAADIVLGIRTSNLRNRLHAVGGVSMPDHAGPMTMHHAGCPHSRSSA